MDLHHLDWSILQIHFVYFSLADLISLACAITRFQSNRTATSLQCQLVCAVQLAAHGHWLGGTVASLSGALQTDAGQFGFVSVHLHCTRLALFTLWIK